MPRTSAVIIGAGQAGLAMSRCLATYGIEHVVLERGRVAERWRSERWDSLRLLTPNWMSRLPDWAYRGPDPDGFMTMPEVAAYLTGYAASLGTPIETATTVHRLRRFGDGYCIETDRGTWRAPVVVIATGACDRPFVPALARGLPHWIEQVVPTAYRRPADVPEGGVLIVGASATGVQLAEELQRSGRPVTLSVGSHTRLPRRYRGRDILWWLDRIGLLHEPIDRQPDPLRARSQPSLQLVGRPDGRSLNLGVLHDLGVRIVGRAEAVADGHVRLRADLPESIAAAQRKLERLLDRIDAVAGRDAPPADPEARRPIVLPAAPAELNLKAAGIRSVVWATGYRRDDRWLQVPVLGADGEIRHDRGVTPAPGLYVLGLRFLRRRNSSFIDGVGADAAALAAHAAAHLHAARPAAA